MKILAYDIYPRQDFIEKYNVTYVSLEKLFKQSDVITLHAPAIKATENQIITALWQELKHGEKKEG